jgi:hypothetical protein
MRRAMKSTRTSGDPIEFERPFSRAGVAREGWKFLKPASVRLPLSLFPRLNKTYDPDVIERESRATLEGLIGCCEYLAIVDAPSGWKAKKQLAGFVAYIDRISERSARILAQNKSVLSLILRELQSMREDVDEPDFVHRPSDYAYETTRRLIESAYGRPLRSIPTPSVAPDGLGGVITEWKLERRVVRLVVASNESGKSYIYSRISGPSELDPALSGLVLFQRLRSAFAV